MNFNYYEIHAFHKLKNNLKLNQKFFQFFTLTFAPSKGILTSLSEVLLDNLKHQFDVIAPTETWHMKNNVHFTPGILSGYQKYEGLAGLSKEGECGVFIKGTIPYITRPDLSINSEFQKYKK